MPVDKCRLEENNLNRRNKIKSENAGSDPRMEIVWPGQNYMRGRNICVGNLVLSKNTTYSCSSMIYRWPEKKKRNHATLQILMAI